MKSLGLRHVALNVKNAQTSKKFYTEFFNMDVEWEPDPKAVYLTSQGHDNLALHQVDNVETGYRQVLNHIGFVLKDKESVDQAYQKAKEQDIAIVKDTKQHRDGAYSFYLKDPDGNIIQVIYHPPISET